jgi:hypothetical protein
MTSNNSKIMNKIVNLFATIIAVATLGAIYYFGIEWHKWKAVWNVLTYKNLIGISVGVMIVSIIIVFLKVLFISLGEKNINSNFSEALGNLIGGLIITGPLLLISRLLHDFAVKEYAKRYIGTGIHPGAFYGIFSSICFLAGVSFFIVLFIKALSLKRLRNTG